MTGEAEQKTPAPKQTHQSFSLNVFPRAHFDLRVSAANYDRAHTGRARFADCYSSNQDRDRDRDVEDRPDAAHIASESSSPLLLSGTQRLTPMRGIVRLAPTDPAHPRYILTERPHWDSAFSCQVWPQRNASPQIVNFSAR